MNQCVGYKRDTTQPAFVLSKQRLNFSVIADSVDGGASWRYLGTFPAAEWRRSVYLKDDTFAFAVGIGILFGKQSLKGGITFDRDAYLVPNFIRGSLQTSGAKELNATHGNLWGHTIVSRVPNSMMYMLAVPTQIKRESGNTKNGRLEK